jgi:hypothetical protein
MNATTETLAQESSTLEVLATRLETLAALNLEDKLSLKVLGEKINEMIIILNNQKVTPSRNRGPASEKVMTEDDARRVMIGDLKGSSHKEAAELLGLSYGQIYSARKGFTFKPVYKEMTSAAKSE